MQTSLLAGCKRKYLPGTGVTAFVIGKRPVLPNERLLWPSRQISFRYFCTNVADTKSKRTISQNTDDDRKDIHTQHEVLDKLSAKLNVQQVIFRYWAVLVRITADSCQIGMMLPKIGSKRLGAMFCWRKILHSRRYCKNSIPISLGIQHDFELGAILRYKTSRSAPSDGPTRGLCVY